MSRARCLSSKVVGAEDSKVAVQVMEANALNPTQKGYSVLKVMVQRGLIPRETMLPYLHEQNRRLENMSVDCAGGFDILTCRQAAAEMLSTLYSGAENLGKAAQWSAVAAGIGEKLAVLRDKWQSKYALICYPQLSVPRVDRLRPKAHP
jgi:hypothetical protein